MNYSFTLPDNIIELELIRDEAVQRLNAEVKDNKTNYTNMVVQNQKDDIKYICNYSGQYNAIIG